MCATCGCHETPALGQLVHDNEDLTAIAARLADAAVRDDQDVAFRCLVDLRRVLDEHIHDEEDVVFPAVVLDDEDEEEHCEALHEEHERLYAAIDSALHGEYVMIPEALQVAADVTAHVVKEDYGIMPLAAVVFGRETGI